MEKRFRLEFNEKKQFFRLDNYTHEPNTNGWITVLDSITDKEYKLFKSVIDLIEPEKITEEFILSLIEKLKILVGYYVDSFEESFKSINRIINP
jgi:hypothetical protein